MLWLGLTDDGGADAGLVVLVLPCWLIGDDHRGVHYFALLFFLLFAASLNGLCALVLLFSVGCFVNKFIHKSHQIIHSLKRKVVSLVVVAAVLFCILKICALIQNWCHTATFVWVRVCVCVRARVFGVGHQVVCIRVTEYFAS